MVKIYQFIIRNFTPFEVIIAHPLLAEIENDHMMDNFIIGMTNQEIEPRTSHRI